MPSEYPTHWLCKFCGSQIPYKRGDALLGVQHCDREMILKSGELSQPILKQRPPEPVEIREAPPVFLPIPEGYVFRSEKRVKRSQAKRVK